MSDRLPELPDGAAERIRAQLGEKITRRRCALTRRNRIVAAAIVAGVLAGGTAVAIAIASPAEQDHVAYCYQSDDLHSPSQEVGDTEQTPGPDGRMTDAPVPASGIVAAAVENCAAVWSGGFLRNSAIATNSNGVPPLVVCMRPDDVPAVFPRRAGKDESDAEFCRGLGLDPATTATK